MPFDANINYSQSTGSNSNEAQVITFSTVDPTTSDVNYPIRKEWLNTSSGAQFILVNFTSTGGVKAANWLSIAGGIDGGIVTDISGPVTPDVSDQIFMNTATTTFTDGTTANTLLVEVQGTQYNLLIGAGTQTVLTQLPPDATTGIAVVSQGAAADPAYDTVVVAGGGTGAVTLTGVLTGNGTSAVTASTITQYGTVIADASNGVVSVAPDATSGVPLISQGAAANPAFGTTVVAGGGTGAVTLTGVLTGNGTGVVTAAAVTEHGVLVGGASNAVGSTAVGTVGQVLTSSGAGLDPVWSNNDGVLSSILVTTFAAGGTFTKDPNMVYCKIECLGGGGAGGGSNISTSSQCSCGGGGGAGEYSFGYFAYAAVGATETVTIGAAGAGISASTGGTGGTTSVGTLITSIGGSGGVAASAGYGPLANSGAGGSGGTGGDFRCRGMRGEYGFGFVEGNSPFQVNVKGGEGANSQYGSGGTPNGGAANLYGAGGGGSITTTSGADATGGSGSAGLVIVTEYIAT